MMDVSLSRCIDDCGCSSNLPGLPSMEFLIGLNRLLLRVEELLGGDR